MATKRNKNLAQCMKKKGWDVHKVAHRIGVHPSTVYRYKLNEVEPRGVVLLKLMDLFPALSAKTLVKRNG